MSQRFCKLVKKWLSYRQKRAKFSQIWLTFTAYHARVPRTPIHRCFYFYCQIVQDPNQSIMIVVIDRFIKAAALFCAILDPFHTVSRLLLGLSRDPLQIKR
eukprot:sb/3478450/